MLYSNKGKVISRDNRGVSETVRDCIRGSNLFNLLEINVLSIYSIGEVSVSSI